jgi:hypothetical protein
LGDLVNNLGVNCVLLHKVAKIKGCPIPDERVNVYLAGLIERFENPSTSFSKFVVSSVEELNKTVIQHQEDIQPHAIPYLVAKYSGDYSTNYNAHISPSIDAFFPSACYSVAQYHSKKMGKREEAIIFGLLALDPEKYISLLSEYYSFVGRGNIFELTEEDYLSFKKDLEHEDKKVKIITATKKIKNFSQNKFLI